MNDVAVIDRPTQAATAPAAPASRGASLVVKLASKYSVEAGKFLSTLKQTAFRQKDGQEVTNEQMMALLVVADQYGLNPFTREIYAFPDKNGVVPVVGIDGWSRIINEHPQFDGIEFVEGGANADGMPAWIEAVIYRKDRSHPTRVREYMVECKRNTGPWTTHPRRMLRHKAMVQCARVAFSFVGIYDEDEAARIVEAQAPAMPGNDAIAALNAQIKAAPQLARAAIAHDPSPVLEPAPVQTPAAEHVEAQVQEPAPPAGDSLSREQIELIDFRLADLIMAIRESESADDIERLRLKAGELLLTNDQAQEIAQIARDRLARLSQA